MYANGEVDTKIFTADIERLHPQLNDISIFAFPHASSLQSRDMRPNVHRDCDKEGRIHISPAYGDKLTGCSEENDFIRGHPARYLPPDLAAS